MPTFTEELSRLRAGNFMGGLAKLGQAVMEERQNETLVETYNKFKADKEGLLTTQEQISETNKRVDMHGQEIDVPADVKAGVDMFAHIDRIEAFQGLYQPYIDAFMTLGDEGVRLATSLSKDLADKISIEEKKGEIPFKQLEYQQLNLKYNWDMAQYQKLLSDEEQLKQAQAISDYMLTTVAFDPDSANFLPTGINNYRTDSEINRITQLENIVLEMLCRSSLMPRRGLYLQD